MCKVGHPTVVCWAAVAAQCMECTEKQARQQNQNAAARPFESGDVVTKELVATERLSSLEEMASDRNVQVTTTQENTAHTNQAIAMFSQVARHGLAALLCRS